MSKNKLRRSGGGVAIAAQQITHEFSGPLPHPEILDRYNQIVPGAAERILALAERQSEHRQQLERMVIGRGIILAVRGQIMAFTLGFVAIVGGFVLLGLGRDAAGITSILGAVVGLVTVFLWGKASQKHELKRKREAAFPPTPEH